MSLFENIFSVFNKSKGYDKTGDVLKNKITTKDQREEAFHELERLDPKIAIPQILKRFTIVIDSGIQDIKEKERCVNFLVQNSEHAKPAIIEFIEKNHRISWACRVAEKIMKEEEYLELLLNNLSTENTLFDDDAIEKNIEILIALKEIKSQKIIETCLRFLTHRNEPLIIAALECIEEQATQNEQAKKLILSYASQAFNDQNSRIIGLSKAIADKHGWIKG